MTTRPPAQSRRPSRASSRRSFAAMIAIMSTFHVLQVKRFKIRMGDVLAPEFLHEAPSLHDADAGPGLLRVEEIMGCRQDRNAVVAGVDKKFREFVGCGRIEPRGG